MLKEVKNGFIIDTWESHLFLQVEFPSVFSPSIGLVGSFKCLFNVAYVGFFSYQVLWHSDQYPREIHEVEWKTIIPDLESGQY